MKIGVDAPWYDDPVERMAFNLYAMECQHLDDIAEKVSEGDYDSWDEVQREFNLSDSDLKYIQGRLR